MTLRVMHGQPFAAYEAPAPDSTWMHMANELSNLDGKLCNTRMFRCIATAMKPQVAAPAHSAAMMHDSLGTVDSHMTTHRAMQLMMHEISL